MAHGRDHFRDRQRLRIRDNERYRRSVPGVASTASIAALRIGQ
jgi:hypothetical protein